MAYLTKNQQDEDQQGPDGAIQAPVLSGQSALAGSDSGGATSSNTSAAENAQASAPTVKGTNFPKLSKYLDANAGGASALGSAVTQGVVDKTAQAGKDYQGAKDQIDNSVRTEVARVNSTPYGATNGTWDWQGPNGTDATGLYGKAQSEAADAQKAAENFNSEAGRTDLINQTFGREKALPGQASGKSMLDQLLLQGDAGAQAKLGAASEGAKGLGGVGQSTAADIAKTIEQGKKDAQAALDAKNPEAHPSAGITNTGGGFNNTGTVTPSGPVTGSIMGAQPNSLKIPQGPVTKRIPTGPIGTKSPLQSFLDEQELRGKPRRMS